MKKFFKILHYFWLNYETIVRLVEEFKVLIETVDKENEERSKLNTKVKVQNELFKNT